MAWSDRGRLAAMAAAAVLGWSGCAHQLPEEAAPRAFRFQQDTFAFANETVWNYVGGSVQAEDRKERPPAYTRRCFVLSRAAVQFWKFARFEPGAKRLGEKELAHRIRQVAAMDVWREPLPRENRVVFPGYAGVKAISAAHPRAFQENVGLGWPTYFRAGNMALTFPPSRAHQERTYEEVRTLLARNYPAILWLANFPSLNVNHAVVAYASEERAGGRTVFLVYDPNDAHKPKRLTYDPKARTFSFEKTFYFKGGTVDVRPIFLSPLQ
jgi:hypothetical protein